MATKKVSHREDVKEDKTLKEKQPEIPVETDEDKSAKEVKEEELLQGTPFKSVEELKKSWQSSQEEGQKVGTALNQIKERAATDPDLNSKLADVFGIPKLEQPEEEKEEKESSNEPDPWVEEQKVKEAKKEQMETDSFVQEHKDLFFTNDGTFNQEEWRKVSNLYPIVVKTAELNNEMISTKEALKRSLFFSKNPIPNEEGDLYEREAEHASQSSGATGSTPQKEVQLTQDQKWIAEKFGLTDEEYAEQLK